MHLASCIVHRMPLMCPQHARTITPTNNPQPTTHNPQPTTSPSLHPYTLLPISYLLLPHIVLVVALPRLRRRVVVSAASKSKSQSKSKPTTTTTSTSMSERTNNEQRTTNDERRTPKTPTGSLFVVRCPSFAVVWSPDHLLFVRCRLCAWCCAVPVALF